MMNQKKWSTEFKVGAFFIIACLLVLGLVIHFSKESSKIKGKIYYLDFSFLNGLQQGASVRYAGGILVGQVLKVEPINNRAKLTLIVNDTIEVDNNTVFSIMSNGLLGEKYINVSLYPPKDGVERELLPEGTEIKGREDLGFDQLLKQVSELAEKMTEIMVPLSLILTNLQETEEIPKLLSSLRSLIDSGNYVLKDNRDSIAEMLKDVRSIISKVDKGEGALGKIINDKVFAQSLEDTISSIDILINKIGNNPFIGSGNNNPNRR